MVWSQGRRKQCYLRVGKLQGIQFQSASLAASWTKIFAYFGVLQAMDLCKFFGSERKNVMVCLTWSCCTARTCVDSSCSSDIYFIMLES